MATIWYVRKRHVYLSALALLLLVAGGILTYWKVIRDKPVGGMPEGERLIHIVTGEFKSTTEDGKVIESYRFDPGTIYVKKGEQVKLVFYGVNGASHPFIIEGTSIKGEVRKGEETIIPFRADKEGVYRIICLIHPDKDHNGPMIGYIVVH